MPTAHRLSLLALLLIAPLAHAERADREKPITIQSERGSADDRNKVQTFEGRVTLTQGTLEITANKLVVTQDAEGYQKGIATGGKDGLTRFRQKKEGKDEYTEGEAERIEYDGRSDVAKLFDRAILRSGPNESKGQYIEYNGYTELYTITNGANNSSNKSGERLKVIILPKAAASQPAGKP
ncbi:lipopolysaccharide transport periplasmic protein LptA [Uliginosibacterium flavum]|uniref:Lipopolysaccharide export system protein LptA n=1 Tax=Uliginosibacterium flavum TaxID=1396831 RepID=A0ABV2TR61_9RHOO